MFIVNKEITEKYEYCRHLKSGCLQIVNSKDEADSIYANGDVFPLDTEIEEIDIAEYIAKRLNGVTENDISET